MNIGVGDVFAQSSPLCVSGERWARSRGGLWRWASCVLELGRGSKQFGSERFVCDLGCRGAIKCGGNRGCLWSGVFFDSEEVTVCGVLVVSRSLSVCNASETFFSIACVCAGM